MTRRFTFDLTRMTIEDTITLADAMAGIDMQTQAVPMEAVGPLMKIVAKCCTSDDVLKLSYDLMPLVLDDFGAEFKRMRHT